MWYGIILGISIIISSLSGYFWSGIMAGASIDICIFLWLKYGRQAMQSFRTKKQIAAKSQSTPAGTGAVRKPTDTDWFIFVIKIALTMLMIWIAFLGISSVLAPEPKPQVWKTVKADIHCPPVWNDDLGGPWCDVGEFPPGVYRIVPHYTAWQMSQVEIKDGKEWYSYTSIPPNGISLGNWRGQPYYDEFIHSAPRGSNQKVGALVVRVGPMIVVDPFFELVSVRDHPERLFIGYNLPNVKGYFGNHQGEIVASIERLQQ